MSSNRYWEERIREEMKIKQKDDTQVGEGLKRLYRHHMNEIEKEIDHFIMKYGADGQVSPAQARKLVDEMDVVSFSEKAKRYVEEKNFSPEANAELKLYNLKMKVSRAEMLKQHLDLELLALTEGETQFAEKWLNRQFYKEMELQAGILGESLPSPKTIGHMAKVIVNTPYQNAVWSERIWKRQDILRREVSKTVGMTLMRGRNSTTMIPEIRKMFDVNSYQAKRLLVTETARMQTEVQKEMYTANDVDEYIFMAEPSACKICSALDGKTFQVSDMTPGKNASPMHPHCHCATAPDASKERAELERLLEKVEREGTSDNSELISEMKRDKLEGLSQARKKGNFVQITDQAIEKVPLVEIPTHSDLENRNLQLAHKQLLKDAKDNNNSNEVMHILIGDNPIVVYGDKQTVDPNVSSSARFILNSAKERTLTVIHNHPGGSSFSMNDMKFFLEQNSVKTMTAVSNQGKVIYVTKTERFNIREIFKYLRTKEIKQYAMANDVEKIVKSLYNLGIRYKLR